MRRTISLALSLLFVTATAGAQIVVGTFSGSANATTINGYVAYIDVAGGHITPAVTPPLAPNAPCSGQGTIALTDTVTFFKSNPSLVLATNANLGPPMPPYPPGACGSPFGLLKNAGATVNPLLPGGASVFFATRTQAVAAVPTQQQANAAQWAVGGFTGTLLVTAGENTGATAQPAPTELAPRVAAGMTKDGKTLIVAMVNGDESSGIGLTLPDFADLLRGLGAWNAVNLDGGGSSTFVYMPAGSKIVQEPSLLALFKKAKPVNPKKLTWTLSLVGANQPCVSYPMAKVPAGSPICLAQPMAPTLYRAIYANWGFSVTPAAK